MAGRVRLSQETPEVDSVNSVIKLRGPRDLPPTLLVGCLFWTLFRVFFFALYFLLFLFALVSFFHDLGTILMPKTAPKSTKITFKTRSGFWRRSVTVSL